MNEEEKEAIEGLNEILKQWQQIINIEDEEEREIEMSLYFEEMPFKDIQTALNLIDKLQKGNQELKEDNSHQWEERCRLTFELEKLQKEKEEYRIGWCNEGKKCEKLLKELNNRAPNW